jgi:transcriptional regulator GlxA family with amidase domain
LNPAPDPKSVDAMAQGACFSRRQFHRLMVQLLGETPGAHQRRVRLDRGTWLLLTSRATVLEIALQTGFENHETFTRAFRLGFGETPSAFRKNQGRTLPPSLRIGLAMAMHMAALLHRSRALPRTKNKS